ncbi:TPA: P-type conjugative transfer protein TrbL [Proteus mirabilis]
MRRILIYGGILLPLLLASDAAMAAIEPAGLLDEVADRFLNVSSTWAGVITNAASWLFWTLAVISMVVTFGFMALRKADLGEFFAEFARFIISTGFFWWLLTNGPKFAMDIINSMRTLAAQASGQARELTPSRAVDIGWDIVVKAAENYSVLSPIDNLSIYLISAAILACMAVVGANVLITLVNAWILSYAGIFVLGFGGGKWTTDVAIGYFRAVLGIALKLFTMTLLVGIAISILDSYYANLSEGAPVRELLLVFVVSLVLTMLIHSVPNVVAGLVPGGNMGTGAGSFSVGAAIGASVAAVGMAAAAAATGGAALAGSASAVMAAAGKASENMAAGTDLLGGMFGGGGSGGDGGGPDGGGGGGGSGGGSTPMASAAGDNSSGSGGGFAAAAAKATRFTADMGANLAKGMHQTAKASFDARVSQTAGGKIAAAIKASGIDQQATESPSNAADGSSSGSDFGDSSLSAANDNRTEVDQDSEVAAFANKPAASSSAT